MEAELFGHEKGAFTDAKQMKKGLFEAADGGTLISRRNRELSPLLQAKLLRVLERPGHSPRRRYPRHAGRRARHRRLQPRSRKSRPRKPVPARIFITPPRHYCNLIPPLRDRKEDIMPLVEFFIDPLQPPIQESRFVASPTTRARLILAIIGREMFASSRTPSKRGMILRGRKPLLRPLYPPFSVGESRLPHRVLRSAPLPRRRRPALTQRTGHPCRALYPRRRGVLGKRWSTPHGQLAMARRPTTTKPTPPKPSTSSATPCATS